MGGESQQRQQREEEQQRQQRQYQHQHNHQKQTAPSYHTDPKQSRPSKVDDTISVQRREETAPSRHRELDDTFLSLDPDDMNPMPIVGCGPQNERPDPFGGFMKRGNNFI